MKQNILKSKRLILKILTEKHANITLDYYLRNKEFLNETSPKRDKKFYTLKEQQEFLKKEKINIKTKNQVKFWIFLKDNSERTIGFINFSNIVFGCFLSCFLGYNLDKDSINKGYITEALNIGIDYIFKEVKLHRIEANIMPRNNASIRVTEKLGFVNEGYSKNYLKINGKWEDHIHMVLLNKYIEE